MQETYMVDMVYYVDEIIQVLSEQFKGTGKPLLYLLHGLNTDSGNLSKPASFEVSLHFHPFSCILFRKTLLISLAKQCSGDLLLRMGVLWSRIFGTYFVISCVLRFLLLLCLISGDRKVWDWFDYFASYFGGMSSYQIKFGASATTICKWYKFRSSCRGLMLFPNSLLFFSSDMLRQMNKINRWNDVLLCLLIKIIRFYHLFPS